MDATTTKSGPLTDDADVPTAVTESSESVVAAATAGAVPPVPTTPLHALSATNAAEYAAQPLFGSTIKRKRHVVDEPPPPPRQLGQVDAAADAATAIKVLELDEDGFAPVVKAKRKNARKPN
jgi:hypothetical protein